MMNRYYIKDGADVWGVPNDSVELFTPQRGEALVAAGRLERYDEKKHGAVLRRQEEKNEQRRLAEEALLKEERENPAKWRAGLEARRKAAEKEEAKRAEESRKEMLERPARVAEESRKAAERQASR